MFVTYKTSLARETDISNVTKRMLLLSGLHSEVRSMMHRSVTYEAVNIIVNTAIQAENYLNSEAKCLFTWSKKAKATNKFAVKQEQQ